MLKIKNLKVFEKLDKNKNYDIKKNFKMKACAVALTGIMFLPVLGGCSNKKDVVDTQDEVVVEQEYLEDEEKEQIDSEVREKVFDVGEHIISKEYYYYPMADEQIQYECPKEYEIIDIEIVSGFRGTTDGVLVFYQNKESVLCKSSDYDEKEEKFLYEDFGIPVQKDKTYTK